MSNGFKIMPPLILEFGVAIALVTGLVKITATIARIEYRQTAGQAEVLGRIDVLRTKIDRLEIDSLELKSEMKEYRKFRSNDSY